MKNIRERLNKAKERLSFIQTLELERDIRDDIVRYLQQEINNLEEIERIRLYETIYI